MIRYDSRDWWLPALLIAVILALSSTASARPPQCTLPPMKRPPQCMLPARKAPCDKPACDCGCALGDACRCLAARKKPAARKAVTRRAARAAPARVYYSQPVYYAPPVYHQPVMHYGPPPMMAGGFGGGLAPSFGGLGGGCSGGG